MRSIFRIFGLILRKHKGRLFLGYVAVIGTALFAMVIPRLVGDSVDRILRFGTHDVSALVGLALALLLAGVARGLFAFAQTYFAESTSQYVAYDIRNAYFTRLQHLSFGFHDKQMTGELMSRATADVEAVRMFINMGAVRAGFIFAMVLAVAVAMFLTDVLLALVSLTFIPLIGWRAVVTSRKLRRIWLGVQELTADLTTVLQENLSGQRVVKAFAAESYENHKFDNMATRVTEETFRAERLWAYNFSFMNFLFVAALGALLWVGGQQVMAGRTVVDGVAVYSGLTPGDVTAFLFYMTLMTMPVRQLGFMVNNFSRAMSSGERIFEILDQESQVQEKADAVRLAGVKGRVTFENVSFSYDGEHMALKGINVDVAPGKTVALLGRPGSGKTTFAHLIPRFYDPTEGRILIDGVDVRDMILDSLRDAVGLVQQDNFIYMSSIRDNIAYGKMDAPLEDVVQVSSIAQLHNFVEDLPDGYETKLGERGTGLSGGQKQRLSIARTILRNPPILIMDDSTSSVDAHTERQIRDGMKKVIEGRTTFIITHRLTSLLDVDEILVFKDGRIVERGTHEELLRQDGEYREIYNLQLHPSDRKDVNGAGGHAPEAQPSGTAARP
jgi:ATP-binding cassette subfamily B protein